MVLMATYEKTSVFLSISHFCLAIITYFLPRLRVYRQVDKSVGSVADQTQDLVALQACMGTEDNIATCCCCSVVALTLKKSNSA